MILVDTSVWVHHFRNRDSHLYSLLRDSKILIHPFVVGEIGCGNLKRREEILTMLSDLPAATVAEHDEVFALLESEKLYGLGLGWIDLHLLASAMLSKVPFWTNDRRLGQAAQKYRLAYVSL